MKAFMVTYAFAHEMFYYPEQRWHSFFIKEEDAIKKREELLKEEDEHHHYLIEIIEIEIK